MHVFARLRGARAYDRDVFLCTTYTYLCIDAASSSLTLSVASDCRLRLNSPVHPRIKMENGGTARTVAVPTLQGGGGGGGGGGGYVYANFYTCDECDEWLSSREVCLFTFRFDAAWLRFAEP